MPYMHTCRSPPLFTQPRWVQTQHSVKPSALLVVPFKFLVTIEACSLPSLCLLEGGINGLLAMVPVPRGIWPVQLWGSSCCVFDDISYTSVNCSAGVSGEVNKGKPMSDARSSLDLRLYIFSAIQSNLSVKCYMHSYVMTHKSHNHNVFIMCLTTVITSNIFQKTTKTSKGSFYAIRFYHFPAKTQAIAPF